MRRYIFKRCDLEHIDPEDLAVEMSDYGWKFIDYADEEKRWSLWRKFRSDRGIDMVVPAVKLSDWPDRLSDAINEFADAVERATGNRCMPHEVWQGLNVIAKRRSGGDRRDPSEDYNGA